MELVVDCEMVLFYIGFVDRKASTGSDSVFEEGNGDVNAMSAAMAMSGNGRPGNGYKTFLSLR